MLIVRIRSELSLYNWSSECSLSVADINNAAKSFTDAMLKSHGEIGKFHSAEAVRDLQGGVFDRMSGKEGKTPQVLQSDYSELYAGITEP